MKFQEICSVYPLNAPAAVGHAAPHFELGRNLYVYILLINLVLKFSFKNYRFDIVIKIKMQFACVIFLCISYLLVHDKYHIRSWCDE